MLGIVLISHGNMADGMVDSARMLFGETGLTQVSTVSLFPEEGPEDFDVKLTDAVKEVDSGEGVIILADLLGGTPCNRAAYKCLEGIQVITGMNLPLFAELLGLRMGGSVDIDNLISVASDGIVNLNLLLKGD
jgi:mannose/fructose/sorbose-specific phosphotransferase system IIA component